MRRFASSSATSVLASFPEWAEGAAHVAAGRHAAAIVPLQRVVEVCDSVMGADSPASTLALSSVLAAHGASGAASAPPSGAMLERLATSAHATELDLSRTARCALNRGMLDLAEQCGARLQRHGAANGLLSASAEGAASVATALLLRGRVARAAAGGGSASADALTACARMTLDDALTEFDDADDVESAPLLLLLGAASHDEGDSEGAVRCCELTVARLDATAAADGAGALAPRLAAWRCDALSNIGAASLVEAPPDLEAAQGVLERALGDTGDVDEGRRGRAVALMAVLLHRQEKAVSAEGLFRSGIDSLRAAAEASSGGALALAPRRALSGALRDYAALLAEWDKREGDAACAASDAAAEDELARRALALGVALGGESDASYSVHGVPTLGMGVEQSWGGASAADAGTEDDGDNVPVAL